jgi:hypothetical protein
MLKVTGIKYINCIQCDQDNARHFILIDGSMMCENCGHVIEAKK